MQLPYQKNRDTLLKVSHTNFSPEERELESTHDFFWCVSRKKEVAAKKIGLDYYPMGYQLRKFDDGGGNHRYGFQGEYAEDETESIGYNTFEARFYDPVVGRWLSMDPAGQFHSPYAGMGGYYTVGADPDGRELVTAILIGAAIGASLSAASYTVGVLNTPEGWANFSGGEFAKNVLIGGVAGAVGGGVGSAFSGTAGGFWAGAAQGAASGAAGGFTSGALSGWAAGAPMGDVLSSALKGGLLGGAAGGLLGGTLSGIQALSHGANFFSGQVDPFANAVASINEVLPPVTITGYKSGFWDKFRAWEAGLLGSGNMFFGVTMYDVSPSYGGINDGVIDRAKYVLGDASELHNAFSPIAKMNSGFGKGGSRGAFRLNNAKNPVSPFKSLKAAQDFAAKNKVVANNVKTGTDVAKKVVNNAIKIHEIAQPKGADVINYSISPSGDTSLLRRGFNPNLNSNDTIYTYDRKPLLGR